MPPSKPGKHHRKPTTGVAHAKRVAWGKKEGGDWHRLKLSGRWK